MPSNANIVDIKPQMQQVIDLKPNNDAFDPSLNLQLYSTTIKAGQLVPVGMSRVMYLVDQTFLSPYNP